jgi:hypothetical protein
VRSIESLPSEIQVFRGACRAEALRRDGKRIGKHRLGIAWTLDQNIALYFALQDRAHRTQTPILLTGVIERKSVLGYFTQRQESEIVLNPRYMLSPPRIMHLEREAMVGK